MRKKFKIWKVLLVIITLILLFIGYRIYKFNSIGSKVEFFQMNSNENSKFIGVLSNNYYKVENDKFYAFNVNNEKLFEKEAKEIVNIIYDKYIYLIDKNGLVQKIDRFSGKEKNQQKLEIIPTKMEYINNNLIIYSDNSITILSNKLEIKDEIKGLNSPVSFSINNNKYSVIELGFQDGKIYSKFNIINNKNKEFSLISNEEVFLKTKIIGENTLLFSTRQIYLINGNSIIKTTPLIDISAIDISKDKIAVADSQVLRVYDFELNEIINKEVFMDVDKLSILKNTIVLLSKDKIKVLENGNLIEENIENVIDSYSKNNEFYLITNNKIQKIKAY